MASQPFTGGDNLTGFDALVHQAMMVNELSNGNGAYELSYAGAKSGLSFGGNQMDIKGNPNGYNVFKDILTNATNTSGVRFFDSTTANTLSSIAKNATQPANQVFTSMDLQKINSALSSDYGVKEINRAYVLELNDRISKVQSIIDTEIIDPNVRAFLNQDSVKLLLIDYDNQLTLSSGGKLVQFLNGNEVKLDGQPFKVSGELDVSDLEVFRYNTHYARPVSEGGVGGTNDTARRLDNIYNIWDNNNINDPRQPSTTSTNYFSITNSVGTGAAWDSGLTAEFANGIALSGNGYGLSTLGSTLNGNGFFNICAANDNLLQMNIVA